MVALIEDRCVPPGLTHAIAVLVAKGESSVEALPDARLAENTRPLSLRNTDT